MDEKTQALDYEEETERARQRIAEHGIEIPLGKDAADYLLGELSSRGWSWEFAPGGMGYNVECKKTVAQTQFQSIAATGRTLEEALVRTLDLAL